MKINPVLCVLSFIGRHSRVLLSVLAILAGGYLIWSGFQTDTCLSDMREWLKENGDSNLLRYYDEAKDAKDRTVWAIAFKSYEKRYGKGAWVQHFEEENLDENVAYRDIAKLAIGMSSPEEREEFLAAHAAVYESCVQNGEIGLALRYGAKLNVLMTCEPELEGGGTTESTNLADVVAFVREHSALLKQFAMEIVALSTDDLKGIADGDGVEESKEALFASCLLFVSNYHDVLKPMIESASKIPMLEAMAVVANNCTAFGLDEEGAIESPSKCRNAAMGFLRIHDERKIVWDFAMDERGIDAITLCEKVGNYEWSEQVIGMYGEAEVVSFLNKYYGKTPQLLRVATETLYRCQEPGWAVLQEYRDNQQVKSLLQNPRIGYRLVPYYLKKGYDGFSQLAGDERWIDELLDKNGNLKRMDVSWYEMMPIGGDVATVVKKWAQDRPVTAGEMFWAGVDVLDTAGMAISFGMTKVATTGARVAGKTTAKQIGKKAARNVAKRIARDITKKTARKVAKSTALRTTKHTTKVGARKISFLRKVNKWFRKMPAITSKGRNSVEMAKRPTKNLLGNAWRATKNMDQKAWQRVYKGCKTIMWCRYLGHTVPEKGSDFTYTLLESAGEFVGKTLNSFVAGAGDGLKAAVREALGLPKGGNFRPLNWVLGGILFLLGLFMFVRKGH